METGRSNIQADYLNGFRQDRRLNIIVSDDGCFERFVIVRILQRPITVSAVSLWRTALQRERCLPSSVMGPVLLQALRRLASICLKEVIERQPQ